MALERRPAQAPDTLTARPTREQRATMVRAFEAAAVRNRAQIARERAERPRIEAQQRANRARLNRGRDALAKAQRKAAKLRARGGRDG
jgi:hypothetical protein